MTPVILPLVASLVAVGVPTDSYRPSLEPAAAVMDLRAQSAPAPALSDEHADAVERAVAGSGYPEAFQWSGGEALASIPASGAPRQSVLVTGNDDDLTFDAGLASAEAFEVSSGTRLIGVGFRWRFR